MKLIRVYYLSTPKVEQKKTTNFVCSRFPHPSEARSHRHTEEYLKQTAERWNNKLESGGSRRDVLSYMDCKVKFSTRKTMQMSPCSTYRRNQILYPGSPTTAYFQWTPFISNVMLGVEFQARQQCDTYDLVQSRFPKSLGIHRLY